MIPIVDYRAGNLTSVKQALEFLGHRCEITDDADKLRGAERVILPGVGAAGSTMENLRALGLADVRHGPLACSTRRVGSKTGCYPNGGSVQTCRKP